MDQREIVRVGSHGGHKGRGSRDEKGLTYSMKDTQGELTGTVLNTVKDFGFIRPDKKLPPVYDRDDVHFHFSHVDGGIPKMGYTVVFKIRPNKFDKPTASFVRSKQASSTEIAPVEKVIFNNCTFIGEKKHYNAPIKATPCDHQEIVPLRYSQGGLDGLGLTIRRVMAHAEPARAQVREMDSSNSQKSCSIM